MAARIFQVYKAASARPGEKFRRVTHRCSGKIAAFAHGGEKAHKWYIPTKDCCKERACTCPACVSRNTKERFRRIKKHYEKLGRKLFELTGDGGVSLLCIVFTVPKGYKTDDISTLSRLRKSARSTAEKWLAGVNGIRLASRQRCGWRLGGVDTIHPEGDAKSGWHPHIHMELPAVAWYDSRANCNCEFCSGGAFHTLRLRVPEYTLKALRSGWGAALYKHLSWRPSQGAFGWAVDTELDGGPTDEALSHCSVNYGWRTHVDKKGSDKNRKKLSHRIRYDFRHWPGWRADFRRITWWGFMSSAGIKKLGIKKDTEPPDKHDKQPENVCPCCGKLADARFLVGDGTFHKESDRRNLLIAQRAPPWMIQAEIVFSEPRIMKIWTD